MRASPQRLARATKPALDAGTRQNMYITFVKNAMVQKGKHDLKPYEELVAQFHTQAGKDRPSDQALASWFAALSHIAPTLDRSCSELVEAVLEFPWLSMPSNVADAWVRFVCALVSARNEWITKLASLTFSCMGLHPIWYNDAWIDAKQARLTRRQLYDRIHALLQNLLRLVPTLPSALQTQLLRHFPHKRERTLAQVLYVRNLLRVTEYCEALTESIWAAIIDHVLQVDVEIQVELDELEEQGVEPTETTALSSVLDCNVEDDQDSLQDTSDTSVSPRDQHLASIDPSDATHRDPLEDLEELDDEDTYDMNDSLLPAHPVEHEPAWNEIAKLAGKLDALMKSIFDFLDHHVGHGHTASQSAHSYAVIDQRRYQLYQILLGIFTRAILPTFKSRHVQFVLFWYSSMDTEFADMFLGTLLSKSLYTANGSQSSDTLQGPDSAGFVRIAAASYVASFVARAKYIDGATTRMVLLNLCTYLDACLEAFAQQGANAPPPGRREHTMFYAVAQAVFYVFCFRWRDLRHGSQSTPNSHNNDTSTRLELHSHEDESRSLAHTYPTACSFDLSPQLLPTLNGTSFSSASSSASGLSAEAGWTPGLAVVQRAITSPLNPLRYCNANVVNQFAHVAQHTGFLYCYSVLEANATRSTSTATPQAPDTPQKPPLSRASTARISRESTPQAGPLPSEAPAAVPAKTLDVFFPFDPYRLRDSSEMIQRLYREWSEAAPDGDDDDDDVDEEALDENHDDDDDDDQLDHRLGALPMSRTRLHPNGLRRASLLSSSNDPSITPESVAQSLEAMSISPFAG
ncbi:DNA independent RNA polymerase I transcription factor [Malassezia psittaci]|uniref:DNA independent RNA polymerase I transcription factor n=1 Tax=Malassezia psittaci TaxID=1821823 RepID=A0AAF0FEM0_9BASI|nr:DNA independent RNA polymerase I transcription factor [Malassezia psittaci]